ncbi:hypothetical protein CVU75_00365 [Candidatus Dependentiae bacterium HGW-Dependentiae-1]|nr:MAG: hypothetical protein CVU75_00365 [Candidatus Dependentiae bacterium HGW-Dependentiae-1]
MKEITLRTLTSLTLGTLFFWAYMYIAPFYFSLVLAGILLQVVLFEWRMLFDLKKPLFWILMPLYPILPFILLILINQQPAYHPLLLVLFVLVCSHDTGSYLFGSLLGKNKIAPTVSPGKTWEGFWGGYLVALGTLSLLLWIQKIQRPLWQLALLTLLVCALSLAGDLFESWLKRRARIKDTGDILPGHGGFLDRFDGILFAVFFFYLFRDYLSTLLAN